MKYILSIAMAGALIATPLSAAPALGGLTTAGSVWSNQVALPSGSTVYAGDLIETGKDALAVLSSPTVGRIEIRGESKAALADGAVVLNQGVVAANKSAVRLSEFEITAQDPDADNWFVVSEQGGERMVAAYRGDVTVRSGSTSFVVPQGSFALAAAAPPLPQGGNTAEKEDDDDDDKAAARVPRSSGRAAGAASKSGWSIGNLGHAGSIALVTAGTAAAITGAATVLTNDPASPQD